MKKNYIEPYKKLIINWHEGGLSYKHYKEKLIITKDKISFKRTVDCLDDSINDVFNTAKWCIKVEDDRYPFNFFKLCESFVSNCDSFKVDGSDMSMLSIELVLDDNSKIKESYLGNIKDNDLHDFNKLLKEFIPKMFSKPHFLG